MNIINKIKYINDFYDSDIDIYPQNNITYISKALYNNPQNILINPIKTFKIMYLPHISLNNDIKIQNMTIKFVYYKVIDEWLYNDLQNILNNFVINDKKVITKKNIEKYNDKEKKIIIDHIVKNIYFMDDVKKTLKKLISESDMDWIDIYDNIFFVKIAIEKNILDKIK
jgi:hypothetical protein